ncbi:MAG: Hsp33 family molecular chaperone HslO [Dialister invisus]
MFQGRIIPRARVGNTYKEGGFSIIKEAPVAFRCTCSEERIKTALVALRNLKEFLC